MESERLSRIWTPREKPVVLDKFCHLSLDAQKVMAAMYRDFHQRRAEITSDISWQNTAQRGSFNRHYSDVESSSSTPQKRGSFQEQRLHNLHYEKGRNFKEHRNQDAHENRQGISDLGENVRTFKETGNANCNTDESSVCHNTMSESKITRGKFTNRYVGNNSARTGVSARRNSTQVPTSTISEGLNNSTESPAVETRDFEILSQFHIVDTQDDLFSESGTSTERSSEAMSNGRKTENGPSSSFNDTLNRERVGRVSEKWSSAASSDNFVAHERNDRSEGSCFEMTGSELNHSSLCNTSKKSKPQQSYSKQLKRGRNTGVINTEDREFLCGYRELEDQADKNWLAYKLYDGADQTNGAHSDPRPASMVRDLNIDFITKVTGTSVRDEGLCEESPYLDRTPEVDRRSHTKTGSTKSSRDDSCKKPCKLKQSKISFERLRSDGNKDMDSGSVSGKKHFIEKDGENIPVKKHKLCKLTEDASDSVTSYPSDIVYIHELTVADIELVCSEILDAEEVVLCLVFTNGCTQLRGNLFGTDSKTHKKPAGKVKKDLEVESIALWKPGTAKHKVYLFSVQDQRQTGYDTLRIHRRAWCTQSAAGFLSDFVKLDINIQRQNGHSRDFWKSLMSTETIRKIGFQTKEVIMALLSHFSLDYNRVDLSWTLLDAGIAIWLLDPDKPIGCFDQLLTALNLPEQTPSKSCIDALQDDMVLLSLAMKKLYKVLQSKEMWSLFVCLEAKLANLLAGMEMRQISISIHSLLQFSSILKRSLTRLEEKAYRAAGHAFLLNSHHQLRQVLFEELQLDSHLPGKARLAKTSVTRETSTSETVLTQLQPFHPLPTIILEYRQLQKLKSTYIDGILSCITDSYLTTHWDQTSAATGRLTSHHPNIQAIPKLPVTIKNHETNYVLGNQSTGSDETILQFNARDPFISKPQWSLLAADFQQIELRLLGHLANDPVLINIFSDPKVPDIFNALAAQWLGKAVADVAEADREQTKRVVYSVMYGVGKEKLADYLKCSSESAKAIMASFLLKFPAVNQFTKSRVEFCQKNGYTCSIFKRRRLFPNIRHHNPSLRAQAERQCVNFCVQGSAADICKAAMLQVENALAENPKLKARLMVQIHDELLLEVADSDLNEVTGLVKHVMESEEKLCGSVVKLKVPIPVSVSVGKKWGHMEPVLVPSNED